MAGIHRHGIEVTPEMVEVGKRFVWERDFPPDDASSFFMHLFWAMELAKQKRFAEVEVLLLEAPLYL
jgi:hypothetical protein